MKMEYKKNPELIEKEMDNKLLLFNVNSGIMIELNETSSVLWKNTKETFVTDDLKDIIKEHCYSIKELDKDLTEFINTALEKNIILENGKKD